MFASLILESFNGVEIVVVSLSFIKPIIFFALCFEKDASRVFFSEREAFLFF